MHARLDPPPSGAPALLAVGGTHHRALRGAVLLFKQHGFTKVTSLLLPLVGAALALVQHTMWTMGERRRVRLVPVPPSRRRPWREPARELAVGVAAASGTTSCAALLRTSSRRSAQKGLDAGARARNITGTLTAKFAAADTSHVCVLLDDVVTTGATLAEAHRALRERGWQVGGAVGVSRAVLGG